MLSTRFDDALVYAHDAHRRQRRKGTRIPYVSHLLAVAATVLEHGGTEDEAIGALLHDVAEDQGGRERLADVEVRFGSAVAAIVEGCTDAWGEPKPPWRKRKESYVAHLKGTSPSVALVSAADKLHNARAILRDHRVHGDALWARFNAPRDGLLWYYSALATAFEARGDCPLAGELREVVDRLLAEASRGPGPD